MPMTCDGCDGLVEVRFSAVMTFWPPMYIGYSRPNSEATFFSASSMALRFSGFEKSMNGSLENSETWIFASAVAMGDLLLNKQTRDCTASTDFATRRGVGGRHQPGPSENRRRARPFDAQGKHAVPLRGKFAGGLGEDLGVEVNVRFGGGGTH